MKIKIVEENKKRFCLILPTRLLFNALSATLLPVFAKRELEKQGIHMKAKDLRKFVRVFYKTRRHFGGRLDIVEVKSSEGDIVKITL